MDHSSSHSQRSDSSATFHATVGSNPAKPLHAMWVQGTAWMRRGITETIVTIATAAATYPYLCIGTLLCLSCAMLTAGIKTNFTLDVELMDVFTPTTSRTIGQREWAHAGSGLPGDVKTHVPLQIIIHAQGKNVLEYAGIRRTFDVLELATSMDGFDALCGDFLTSNNSTSAERQRLPQNYLHECDIQSVTRNWDHNRTEFEQMVSQDENGDVTIYLYNETYPDGTIVDLDLTYGNLQLEENSYTAKALFLIIYMPKTRIGSFARLKQYTDYLESNITALRHAWEEDSSTEYRAEFGFAFSVGEEFTSTIITDLPILPIVFAVMTIFTCSIFWRRNKVQSRLLLGLGSVVTILLSMAVGFGLMFTMGVPFTVVTNLLPYIVFGIGLDDTFIIHGAYLRTNPNHPTVDRIRATFREVGLSITMTTFTTTTAFALGIISTVPAIRYLCIYAAPTVLIDGIYQITFFVSLIVLDERRIQANRMDCCLCVVSSNSNNDNMVDVGIVENNDLSLVVDEEKVTNMEMVEKIPITEPESLPEQRGSMMGWYADQFLNTVVSSSNNNNFVDDGTVKKNDLSLVVDEEEITNMEMVEKSPTTEPESQAVQRQSIMSWYADHLLRPWVKIAVLLSFSVMLVCLTYSATKLRQDFSFYDLLPSDSSAKSYLSSLEDYGGQNGEIYIYFRGMNQSDPVIQEQMIDFIDQIGAIEHVELSPFCWVRDFRALVNDREAFVAQLMNDPSTARVFETSPDVLAFLQSEDSVLDGMTFDQVLDLVLNQPVIAQMYRFHINRAPGTGEVLASRCQVMIKNLDFNSVNDQIQLLNDQTEVTENHPLNQNTEQYHAFLYKDLFHLWEFFAVAMSELKYTAFVGIVTVTVLAFLFVPHWSAVFYVFPLMCILYLNLLGLFNLIGLTINVLTYVVLVVSVGILVDFIMHVLLRYYESNKATRDERVKDTLETMGLSILLGGISTFLGSFPLIFSHSMVFQTVYMAFFSMIALGVTHGIILLPVLLSMFGSVPADSDSNKDLDLPSFSKSWGDDQEILDVCSERTGATSSDDENECPSPAARALSLADSTVVLADDQSGASVSRGRIPLSDDYCVRLEDHSVRHAHTETEKIEVAVRRLPKFI